MTTQDIILIAMALALLVVVVFEWRARLAEEEDPVIMKPTIPPPVPPIKVYRRKYRYIKIEEFGDYTLNHMAEKYQNDGYVMDRDKSTDRLLVFVKSEEVKED